MAARSAWVLNLDADLELAVGPSYVARQSVRAAMSAHAARLADTLLGDRDVVLDDVRPPAIDVRGAPGFAFCPTPSAIALLARRGAVPAAHPSFDVLRSANARSFAAGLGATLPGAAFVTEMAQARAKLDEDPPVGGARRGWRAKRSFGMSGRGQRIIDPRSVSAADVGFLEACLREGGVMIEPNVEIVVEYAMHGVVDGGACELGALVRQRCDAAGAWLETERVPAHEEPSVARALEAECSRVAEALRRLTYFGPFGVDAYTYRGSRGLELQPRSEVNARFTMGFPVGFGPWRGPPDGAST